MTYVKWELRHTPYQSDTYGTAVSSNNTWNTSQVTTLPIYHSPMVTKALGTSKDSFKFKVSNAFGTYNNFFKPNDKIEIYRVINTETVTSSDLLMTGTVNIPDYSVDENGQTIDVSGYSFSEYVLRAITNVDASATTIPYAIKRAIEWVGGASGSQFNITWSATNPMVKSDGSAFPVVNEAWFNQPMYTKIEKWSTAQATGDGSYYFYVDTNNKFQWFRGDNRTPKTFNSTTIEYKSLKHNVDKDGVVNFIISKGGLDPAGKPIEAKTIDQVSFAKYGQKYYMLVSQTVSGQSLVKQDHDASWGSTANATNYPILTSSFTTTWKATMESQTILGVTVTKGSAVTINTGTEAGNKNAYTAIIRKEVEARLKNEALQYMQDIRYGKLELDIEFAPGYIDWQLGDKIACTIPSLIGGTKTLRVHNIQYTTEADTYTLKEDIGSI